MQTEIWFVDMLASFDSLFWPLFPILLYTLRYSNAKSIFTALVHQIETK